jgi:hypothetical protein
MDYTFPELLGEVPNEIFFGDQGAPNYNAIFVEIARRIYKQDATDFMIPSADFLNGKLPNLSSFQRAVKTEDHRRTDSSGTAATTGRTP